jgi:phospholipase C
MGLDMAQNGMSGFKSEAIPVYTSLAEEFVVFDQWFAFVPSSMQPNCLFIH